MEVCVGTHWICIGKWKLRELRPLAIVLLAGCAFACGRPLAAIGLSGSHTRLVWIVVAVPTGVLHAAALVAQRVGIAHQPRNFVGNVSRKGHGKNLGWR